MKLRHSETSYYQDYISKVMLVVEGKSFLKVSIFSLFQKVITGQGTGTTAESRNEADAIGIGSTVESCDEEDATGTGLTVVE